MCGIAGLFDPRGALRDPAGALAAMGAPLAHRGPDDHGLLWDAATRVGFAHRRLAIIDLSSHGHQPMTSASGRVTIAANGELYNAPDLRRDLDAVSSRAWRGHSDTEVMVEAIDQWGCEEAARRFNGMFAFALLDHSRRVLTLARDGVGKKPLVMGWMGGVFAFASELTALRELARVSGAGRLSVDPVAIDDLLRHGCISGLRTIHPGITRVPPGTLVSLRCTGDGGPAIAPLVHSFWSAREEMARARQLGPRRDDPSLLLDFERVLDAAVERRMASDVPLGAFLSGGVDSAIIVALMARHASTRVRSFTIGFDSPEYDETEAAADSARTIGTDHTSAIISARDATAIVPQLQGIYDEPFADSSQVPTLMLCALTRAHVRVALSGDGADELLGGYDRYAVAPQIRRLARGLPSPLRHLAVASLRAFARLAPDEVIAGLTRLGLARGVARPREKAERAAAFLGAQSTRADGLVRGVPPGPSHGPDDAMADDDCAQWMMDDDFCNSLVDDLLVKIDRASMSMALEVRSPFLDRDVAEFAWRVPMSAKIHADGGKWLSRQLARKLLGPSFGGSPKMGFGAPIHEWLRTDLRPWAEDLLSSASLARDDHLDAPAVRARWEAFLAGHLEDRHLIWSLLSYRSWVQAQRSSGLL